MKNNILFGYASTPSCGLYGMDDGGFSVEIDKKGVLIYKTYLFEFIEQTIKIIFLSSSTLNQIKNILEKNAEIINNLDTELDNGSCDGVCNRFIFSGKKITAWNIDYTNESMVAKKQPDYYRSFKDNMKQENEVLQIFKLICKELIQEGIKLDLDKFRS